MRRFPAIHEPYSEDERHGSKVLVHATVAKFPKRFALRLTSWNASESSRIVMRLERNLEPSCTLWTDDALKTASQLDKSALCFLNALDRINIYDYTPTDSDILRCKAHPPPPLDELYVKIGVWTYSLVCARQTCPCDTNGSPVLTPSRPWFSCSIWRGTTGRYAGGYRSFRLGLRPVQQSYRSQSPSEQPESLGAKLVTSPLGTIYADYVGDDELAAVKYIFQPFRTVIVNAHRSIYPHFVDLADVDACRPVINTITHLCDYSIQHEVW
ncbi:hypothetical protein C8R44DRAFT_798253 [Mycena epipterygia]|nr:hypothetical protein C8R44DRAFT_798253 [Mycena epipterygia]